MNNKLEALRESFDKQFINLCSIVIPKEGNHLDMDRKEEVWNFFLSRFATIMDEVVESIVPEEKEVGHILECNMCSPKCGWNSAIATIKNNYKEIKQ